MLLSSPTFFGLKKISVIFVPRHADCNSDVNYFTEVLRDMWMTPEEYAGKYRISVAALYPALRKGRVPGAKRVGGQRQWRIWDDEEKGD